MKPNLNCNAYVQNIVIIIQIYYGSLWKIKSDEVPANNADLSIDNSKWFKYKAALIEKTVNVVNNTKSSVKDAKIVASSIYLSNFWRSLEMSLLKCKIHHELTGLKTEF